MHLAIRDSPCTEYNEEGLTLLEVLIALALLNLLGGIVFLQLAPFLTRTRLNNATRQVVTDLQYVRMKAISQNRRFRVTFRPDTRDYSIEKDEDGSWQRQLLHSHVSEEVTTAFTPLPPNVQITAVNSGGDVIFLPRGAVDGGITITLGTASGEDTKRVIVNLAGRVRVE
jgi:Tfp pilus assembly protein FimT